MIQAAAQAVIIQTMRRFQRTPGLTEQPQARIRLSQWDESLPDAGPAPVPREFFPQTPLRWRWFGGYRREDVELLLAECRMMIRQVERKLEPLRDRERDLEAEISSLRGELAGALARADASQQLEGVLAQVARIEQTASEQALWLTLMGEEENQTDEERTRVQELLRLNHDLLWNVQGLVAGAGVAPEEAVPAPEVETAAAAEPPVPPEIEEAPPEPELSELQLLDEAVVEPPPVEELPEPDFEPAAAPEPQALEPAPQAPEPLPEQQAQEPGPEVPLIETLAGARAAAVATNGDRVATDERHQVQRRELPSISAAVSLSPSKAVFGAAAALLVLAIILAAAGHATAAVILLALFALGIAFLSMFGIGIDGNGVSLGSLVPRSSPLVSRRDDRREVERIRRELAQLAAERDRVLLELGDAVTSGEDEAVADLRERVRELNRVIQQRAIEIASGRQPQLEHGQRPAPDGEELLA